LLSLGLFCWVIAGVLTVTGPDYAAFSQSGLARAFLWLDPLLSLVVSLASGILAASAVIGLASLAASAAAPRAFCGYLCPLGTMIDLFDWAIGNRFRRLHRRGGRGRHVGRFIVLAGVMALAAGGVMAAGFVAAIPLATRGAISAWARWQLLNGRPSWEQLSPGQPGLYLSLGLLLLVLALGAMGRRFWCRRLCPSGAMFSLMAPLRLSQRTVNSACIRCGKCEKSCPFGAIDPDDFSTRHGNCTFCQTCGGVCPTRAIHFAPRWARSAPLTAPDGQHAKPPGEPVDLRRRELMLAALVGLGGLAGGGYFLRKLLPSPRPSLVRPPGALEEDTFLAACIRCGQCIEVCPTRTLQPVGLEGPGLWTPRASGDLAPCDSSCNLCGQVCPTGAIARLDLPQKRERKMGRAAVEAAICLAFSRQQECMACQAACANAGYFAIESVAAGAASGQAAVAQGDQADPPPPAGVDAPVVSDRCVGCGACQAACMKRNVREAKLLPRPAIRVFPIDA
jgi:polyferredoxin